jgi:hypothetical protein
MLVLCGVKQLACPECPHAMGKSWLHSRCAQKCSLVLFWIFHWCCVIVDKIGTCQRIIVKPHITKFHKNLFNNSWFIMWGQADGKICKSNRIFCKFLVFIDHKGYVDQVFNYNDNNGRMRCRSVVTCNVTHQQQMIVEQSVNFMF